jgi:predicted nucleic acid-binding protein
VRRAADTSVSIPALLTDHDAHELAEEALSTCEATIAHVGIETYSVLTRLPPPHRIEPADAGGIVAARLPAAWVSLDAHSYRVLLGRLAEVRVAGGATYDGLIALAALEHGLELVSRDRRAAQTYRALEVPFQLIG